MNSATKNLMDDHIQILKLLDVMDHISHLKDPDTNHLESIVDIIRNFADGLHHAKEEDILFPFLEEKGFSPNQGPVAVMLNEHVQGRLFVKGMADNIPLFKRGESSVLTEIVINMKGYIELLRAHISKEDNILFKMTDNVTSDADNINLLNQFGEAERKHLSKTPSGDYIAQINELAVFYKL